ncbi:hypothetical protein NPIL_100561 [Nephila pilipes]|uniref:Uncharacterized protein n=1 Tax=Nephila pilipes TaxID=299642 RepID=A0A8X6N7P3_NEPPI|nr:hypothetical protein NPIL_100561 [Nephila pilipes]
MFELTIGHRYPSPLERKGGASEKSAGAATTQLVSRRFGEEVAALSSASHGCGRPFCDDHGRALPLSKLLPSLNACDYWILSRSDRILIAEASITNR